VCCSHVYHPFSSLDPAFWPAAKALKKSGAVPAEIIAGHRRIKPSTKAKRAAGINTSDEEESDGNSDNVNANAGSKRKAGKSKDNSTSKKRKLKEPPKKTQAHRKSPVDSDAAGSMDGNGGDQADAYEKLQLERKTDRPVL
jgi:hypothetical protein